MHIIIAFCSFLRTFASYFMMVSGSLQHYCIVLNYLIIW
jgi:hypothetical protein